MRNSELTSTCIYTFFSHLGAPIYTGGAKKRTYRYLRCLFIKKLDFTGSQCAYNRKLPYIHTTPASYEFWNLYGACLHAPSRPVQSQYGISIGLQVKHMSLWFHHKSIVAVKKVVNKPKYKICLVHYSYSRSRCGLVPRVHAAWIRRRKWR